MKLIVIFMFLLLSLWIGGCQSNDGEKFADTLMEQKQAVSNKIGEYAHDLDIYAANKKYVSDANKTRLIIYNSFSLKEGGERTYRPYLGLHLHLPNLQRKLQLRFTTYKEDAETRGVSKSRYRTKPSDPVYSTSLTLFQDLGSIKTEFRPLVEFNKKVQTSYLLRFWNSTEIGFVSIEPEGQLFARSDTGTGQFTGLNFGFKLNPDNNLTLINEEQYTDGDNTLSTNHGLRWNHAYSEILFFENSLIFESNNRPAYHLDRYIYRFTFEHQIRKDTLHYSLTPYLSFEKDQNFRPISGLDLRVELIF